MPLNVEDSGRILSTQEIALTNDGEPTTVKVHFTANEAGARTIRFRIPPQQGEEITQNNVREVLLDVQDRKEKILFFDGEPHFEVKFIRRAVADDPNLQLVVLQRTTDTKYFRILIDSPDELAAGFPKTRDELFSYRGLILGSIEANAFTGDQLRMIADFADRRGGGLMMIGGRAIVCRRRIRAERRWPTRFRSCWNRSSRTRRSRIQVTPTRAGAVARGHADREDRAGIGEAVGRAAAGHQREPDSTNQARRHRAARAASTRAAANRSRSRTSATAAARRSRFPSTTRGRWQMDAKIPVEDMTHETYWRQLMRWLVDGVPDQVELTTTPDQVEPGEEVTLIAEVSDPGFLEVNDAGVNAHVTGPKGVVIDVPLQWTGERNGEYRGTFSPTENGAVRGARRRRARRHDARHQRARTCASRRATASISTRRCARRCCAASRRRPAASITRRRPCRRSPTTSSTRDAA